MAFIRSIVGVRASRWLTPFGDPIVQLDCPGCGKRLADVADLGGDLGSSLSLVDRAEFRRGSMRHVPRPQQVYAEPGFSAAVRQHNVGPTESSELWRFKCRCGATPEGHPERLHAKVRDAIARGEHRVPLD